jgi:hypothetical protein
MAALGICRTSIKSERANDVKHAATTDQSERTARGCCRGCARALTPRNWRCEYVERFLQTNWRIYYTLLRTYVVCTHSFTFDRKYAFRPIVRFTTRTSMFIFPRHNQMFSSSADRGVTGIFGCTLIRRPSWRWTWRRCRRWLAVAIGSTTDGYRIIPADVTTSR